MKLHLHNLRSKKIGVTVLAVAVLLGVTIIGYWYYQKYQASHFFSESLQEAAAYPLYYPANLPGGLRPQKDSVRSGEGVTTFSIKGAGDIMLVVSEQAIQKDMDFNSFYKERIEQPQFSSSVEGPVVTGKLNSISVCSLVASKTWVIVSAPNGYEGSLGSICRNMHKP